MTLGTTERHEAAGMFTALVAGQARSGGGCVGELPHRNRGVAKSSAAKSRACGMTGGRLSDAKCVLGGMALRWTVKVGNAEATAQPTNDLAGTEDLLGRRSNQPGGRGLAGWSAQDGDPFTCRSLFSWGRKGHEYARPGKGENSGKRSSVPTLCRSTRGTQLAGGDSRPRGRQSLETGERGNRLAGGDSALERFVRRGSLGRAILSAPLI